MITPNFPPHWHLCDPTDIPFAIMRRKLPLNLVLGKMKSSSGLQLYALLAMAYLFGSWWYFRDNTVAFFSFSDTERRIDGELIYYRRIKRVAGNRTTVFPDEFFLVRPSNANFTAFFQLDKARLDFKNSAPLEPLWTCSPGTMVTGTRGRNLYAKERHATTGERKRKFIFLHVSRTAGFTMRALLKAYASKCEANIVAVTRCVDLNFLQMEGSDTWRNGRDSTAAGQTCFLTQFFNQSAPKAKGQQLVLMPTDGRISSTLLRDSKVDILMGRLSLGVDEYWYSSDGGENRREAANAQYVAFFRDPLHRFVSEIMSMRTGSLTIEESAQFVFEAALVASSQGRYLMHYSNYMITPRQKHWVDREGLLWTPERRLNLTLSNLIEENLLVGLFERMTESLEMLQLTMDREYQVPEIFEFFKSSDNVNKLANISNKNQTLAIVERIQKDNGMMATISEYIKYDKKIYETAVRRHAKQYRQLLSSPFYRKPSHRKQKVFR